MKKLVNKVLAYVLTLAMVIGTFAGTGFVAKAAVGDDCLDVYAKDAEGNAVNGLQLVLKNKEDSSEVYECEEKTYSTSMVSGCASFELAEYEGLHEGTYLLELAENSDWVGSETVEVVISEIKTSYGGLYVDTVNGKAYDKDEGVAFTVKKADAGGDEVSISAIEVSPQEIPREGQEVTVTVKGKNLPTKLYYKRSYYSDSTYWKETVAVDSTAQETAELEGTDTERQFKIDLTGTIKTWDVTYATEYYIEVAPTADGTYSKATLQLESLPEISEVSVAPDTTVSKDGGKVTVTIKGKKLPDEFWYKRNYKWGDELADGTATTVGPVTATGESSEEKTIEVELPATEGVYANAKQWTIAVGSSTLGYKPSTPIVIPIDGLGQTEDPSVSSVTVSPEKVSEEGEDEVTVTVNGTALPENANYKIMYLYSYGSNVMASSTGTKETTLEGQDSTSKTFCVNLPKKSEIEETYGQEITGWRISVSIDGKYGKFVASNDITFEGGTVTPPSASYNTLKLKVVDQDGNAVSGESLTLKSTDVYMDLPTINVGTTGEDGTISYVCKNNEDTYYPYNLILSSNSEYEVSGETLSVDFDYEENSYSRTVIGKVNNEKYDGSEKTITLQKKAPAATISSVTTSDTSVAKEGGNIVVKVTGENLPDKLYYQLGYKWEDSDGSLVDGNFDSAVAVDATGSSTEKEITIALPSAVDTNKRVWKIKVGAAASGVVFKSLSSEITITGFIVDPVKDETSQTMNSLITEADTLDKNSYTEESWKAYADAVAAAKELVNNSVATNADYLAAIEAINVAKAALKEAEKPGEASITSVSSVEKIKADATEVTVTVKGENLPDTFYYIRKYTGDDGFGGTMNYTVDWSAKSVTATGTSTEKTIVIPLPNKSDAITWNISIGLTDSGDSVKVAPITVEREGTTEKPAIANVETSKTTVNAAGDQVTVTVKGTNLPDSLYYKTYYRYEMNGIQTDGAYGVGTLVAVSGTETEKTFVATIPAESENTGKILGWKIAVGLEMNGSYVKSDVMMLKASDPLQDELELAQKNLAEAEAELEAATTEEEKAAATLKVAEAKAKVAEAARAIAEAKAAEAEAAKAEAEAAKEKAESEKATAEEAKEAAEAEAKAAKAEAEAAKAEAEAAKAEAEAAKAEAEAAKAAAEAAKAEAAKYKKPGQVKNLTVKAGKKKATLTWKKVTGATGYKVYRSTSKNGKYKLVKTVKGSVKYTNNNLKSGKKFYYKVRAYKSIPNGVVYGTASTAKYVKVK